MENSLVYALVGPSGVGKTSIIDQLVRRDPTVREAISATTRKPRDGEVHGKSYYFLTKEEFDGRKERGEFIEAFEVFGNWYATLKSEVARLSNHNIIFNVDVNGAKEIKKWNSSAHQIFILPPSRQALVDRMRARGSMSNEDMLRRLQGAKDELVAAHSFDSWVMNENLIETVAEVLGIITLRHFDKNIELPSHYRDRALLRQSLESFGLSLPNEGPT